MTLPQGLQNDGHGGRTICVLLSVWSASKCLKTPESEDRSKVEDFDIKYTAAMHLFIFNKLCVYRCSVCVCRFVYACVCKRVRRVCVCRDIVKSSENTGLLDLSARTL